MYTIDGVPLSDPQLRWRLHRETMRRTPVAIRSLDVQVPGLDGSLPIYGEDVEATALHLELNVYGTPAQVEERCGFLRALLGKTYAPLRVVRRDGLVAEAKPASIGDPVMTPAYARMSVVLTIPSGVWRGPEVTWTHPAPQSDASVVVADLAGGSRAITDAQFLITGPANTPSIEDVATGATLRYTGSVPVGQRLLIHAGEWRAGLGSGSWGSQASNATRDLANTGPSSASHLMTLTPVMSGQSWASREPGVPIVPASGDGLSFAPRLIFRASGTTSNTRMQVRAHTSHL